MGMRRRPERRVFIWCLMDLVLRFNGRLNGGQIKITKYWTHGFFAIGFLVLVGVRAHAEIQLKTEPAKVLGVWSFARSVAGVGQRQSSLMRNLFELSEFSKDTSVKKMIEEFRRSRCAF